MKLKALAVVLAIALVLMIGWLNYAGTTDLGDRNAVVIIKSGDNLGVVIDKLLAEGVVESRLFLKYPARMKGIDKKLTPGRYEFSGKNSCRSVLAKLEAADFVNIKVTIPEGAPIWKVASILADKLEIDSASVIALNQDSVYLADLGLHGLEGYMFPQTYFFPWGTDTDNAIRDIIAMYHQQTDKVWPDTITSSSARYDVLKMASIIEAETSLDNEFGLVSSVYHNRLGRNMKLDADPTVIYGLGGLDRPLWYKDLRKDTPYNTYLHKGLPPTPINSPGLKAIKAALSPEMSDYFYFVADNGGGHRFSRTISEHNRVKKEIKESSGK